MRLSLTRPATIITAQDKIRRARAWYSNIEFYLIVLLAGLLRFYRVDTSDFDADQGLMYRMAYDAVHHGLLPVTNSTASLGFANAPGLIYLLMLPASFSADPLFGVLLTNLLATAAVAITYIFTNRYYGRLAAIVATLLYTTAAVPLFYSRFLWQPNMMHPFVILFMFVLFGAVIERRKGWLAPALILLGILYQTHGTTLLLLAPLALALLFAPETLRWRDLLYSLLGLAVIFFPFLLWHLLTHFSDLPLILQRSSQPATVDTDSLRFYRYMISPFDHDRPPTDSRSLVYMLIHYRIGILFHIMFYLVVAGCLLALGVAVFQWVRKWRKTSMLPRGLQGFWARLVPTPMGAGLLLLCAWQIVPVVALIKHSTWIFPHYLLVVLPGPFILIGFLASSLARCIDLIRFKAAAAGIGSLLRGLFRVSLYTAAALIITAQLINSAASIYDRAHGYFYDRDNGQYYNDLSSIQLALTTADQLATQRHLKRVFVATDFSTENMMYYLTEHMMQHPTTVFTHERCLILPSQADGPAILVMAPYAHLGTALAQTYGAVQLTQSRRLGGDPFVIYELPSAPNNATLSPQTLDQRLQSVGNASLRTFSNNVTPWLVTDWQQLQAASPAYNTTYSYSFTINPSSIQTTSANQGCTFSAINEGDHIITPFHLSKNQPLPRQVAMSISAYAEEPENPTLGPFQLETHRRIKTHAVQLQTLNKSTSINLAIS